MLPVNVLARVLIAIGCGCLVAFGVQLVDAASFQRTQAQALERMLQAPEPAHTSASDLSGAPADSGTADAPALDGLVGRLEIPRLNLSVIVMEGDDNRTLARAVGHVPRTSLPWESGNTVMAGHRDTFFRPLRDLHEGDDIRMITARGTFDYQVVRTEIVDPDNVSALAQTPGRSLTLITCYPFYYVGRAPQRFIIHAR